MEAATLISRCKAGERQALHQFYEQYRPRLLSICRQYTKGDDVAEDLLHDAFVVILTSLDQLRDADKLESWMTSIVRNVGFHYREHLDKEQAALQQMVNEKIIAEETMLMPDYEQLQSLVTQLPEGYQQVFRLSVFEGLSHQEISQLLGIAPPLVVLATLPCQADASDTDQTVVDLHPAAHRHPDGCMETTAQAKARDKANGNNTQATKPPDRTHHRYSTRQAHLYLHRQETITHSHPLSDRGRYPARFPTLL